MRRACGLLLCLMGVSCDSSSPSSVDLTGNWSGQVGQAMSGSALRLTWAATQAGTAVTGLGTLVKPAVNVPATGTLSGTMNGSQLALAYLAPAGSVAGFPSCAISGTGTATVSENSITGTLSLNFTACAGSGLEPTGSDLLALSR
jgi:uncharacterized membrane protein